jgi:hypothetical protein
MHIQPRLGEVQTTVRTKTSIHSVPGDHRVMTFILSAYTMHSATIECYQEKRMFHLTMSVSVRLSASARTHYPKSFAQPDS